MLSIDAPGPRLDPPPAAFNMAGYVLAGGAAHPDKLALSVLGPDHADDRYGMHSPLALNGTSQCVYLVISHDIDVHAEQARKAGAEIVTEPYDTDYGGREYSCRDPEGHIWSIGTYRGEVHTR